MERVSIVGMFCEDIREEKAGGATLLGIFPDNVNVPMIPGAFPKLCIYVRAIFDPTIDPGPVDLALVLADGESQSLGALDSEIAAKGREDALQKGSPLVGLIASITMANLPIMQAGRIKIVATMAGEEIVCGVMNVQVEPQPA